MRALPWMIGLGFVAVAILPPLVAAASAGDADLDRNGVVDDRDLLRLVGGIADGKYTSELDVNRDGRLDRDDLLALAIWWGAAVAATPTPTATFTPTAPPTATPTPTPSLTATPTPSPTPSATFTPLASPTATSTPTWTATLSAIPEVEPNDTLATAQHVGALAQGQSLRIVGRITSGGMSGGDYSGDLDIFRLTLPAQVGLSLTLEWTGGADVDFALIARGAVLAAALEAERPIALAGTLSEGDFYFVLASKNQPADYEISLAAGPPAPAYANNPALLSGKYQAESSTAAFQQWYLFDGAGQYQYWNWSFPTGDLLMHAGSYAVWHPFLLLEHDGEVEAYFLEWWPGGIMLDGSWWGKV